MVLAKGPTKEEAEADLWPCPRCTLLNGTHAPICSVCGEGRPGNGNSGSSRSNSSSRGSSSSSSSSSSSCSSSTHTAGEGKSRLLRSRSATTTSTTTTAILPPPPPPPPPPPVIDGFADIINNTDDDSDDQGGQQEEIDDDIDDDDDNDGDFITSSGEKGSKKAASSNKRAAASEKNRQKKSLSSRRCSRGGGGGIGRRNPRRSNRNANGNGSAKHDITNSINSNRAGSGSSSGDDEEVSVSTAAAGIITTTTSPARPTAPTKIRSARLRSGIQQQPLELVDDSDDDRTEDDDDGGKGGDCHVLSIGGPSREEVVPLALVDETRCILDDDDSGETPDLLGRGWGAKERRAAKEQAGAARAAVTGGGDNGVLLRRGKKRQCPPPPCTIDDDTFRLRRYAIAEGGNNDDDCDERSGGPPLVLRRRTGRFQISGGGGGGEKRGETETETKTLAPLRPAFWRWPPPPLDPKVSLRDDSPFGAWKKKVGGDKGEKREKKKGKGRAVKQQKESVLEEEEEEGKGKEEGCDKSSSDYQGGERNSRAGVGDTSSCGYSVEKNPAEDALPSFDGTQQERKPKRKRSRLSLRLKPDAAGLKLDAADHTTDDAPAGCDDGSNASLSGEKETLECNASIMPPSCSTRQQQIEPKHREAEERTPEKPFEKTITFSAPATEKNGSRSSSDMGDGCADDGGREVPTTEGTSSSGPTQASPGEETGLPEEGSNRERGATDDCGNVAVAAGVDIELSSYLNGTSLGRSGVSEKRKGGSDDSWEKTEAGGKRRGAEESSRKEEEQRPEVVRPPTIPFLAAAAPNESGNELSTAGILEGGSSKRVRHSGVGDGKGEVETDTDISSSAGRLRALAGNGGGGGIVGASASRLRMAIDMGSDSDDSSDYSCSEATQDDATALSGGGKDEAGGRSQGVAHLDWAMEKAIKECPSPDTEQRSSPGRESPTRDDPQPRRTGDPAAAGADNSNQGGEILSSLPQTPSPESRSIAAGNKARLEDNSPDSYSMGLVDTPTDKTSAKRRSRAVSSRSAGASTQKKSPRRNRSLNMLSVDSSSVQASPPSSGHGSRASPASRGEWACAQCTFANRARTKRCEICQSTKPPDPAMTRAGRSKETDVVVDSAGGGGSLGDGNDAPAAVVNGPTTISGAISLCSGNVKGSFGSRVSDDGGLPGNDPTINSSLDSAQSLGEEKAVDADGPDEDGNDEKALFLEAREEEEKEEKKKTASFKEDSGKAAATDVAVRPDKSRRRTEDNFQSPRFGGGGGAERTEAAAVTSASFKSFDGNVGAYFSESDEGSEGSSEDGEDGDDDDDEDYEEEDGFEDFQDPEVIGTQIEERFLRSSQDKPRGTSAAAAAASLKGRDASQALTPVPTSALKRRRQQLKPPAVEQVLDLTETGEEEHGSAAGVDDSNLGRKRKRGRVGGEEKNSSFVHDGKAAGFLVEEISDEDDNDDFAINLGVRGRGSGGGMGLGLGEMVWEGVEGRGRGGSDTPALPPPPPKYRFFASVEEHRDRQSSCIDFASLAAAPAGGAPGSRSYETRKLLRDKKSGRSKRGKKGRKSRLASSPASGRGRGSAGGRGRRGKGRASSGVGGRGGGDIGAGSSSWTNSLKPFSGAGGIPSSGWIPAGISSSLTTPSRSTSGRRLGGGGGAVRQQPFNHYGGNDDVVDDSSGGGGLHWEHAGLSSFGD